METVFKEGDKVITSKGRFGEILYKDSTKSVVQIGKTSYQIYNTELLKVDNAKGFIVEYYMNGECLKETIYIDKRIIVFDINNPNIVFNNIQIKLIKKLNNNNITINKIVMI